LNFWLPKVKETDILELHGYPYLTNSYMAFKFHRKYPIVFTPHHGIFMEEMKGMDIFRHTLLKFYNRIIGFKTLRYAHTIIARTEEELKYYEAFGLKGAVVIPDGVPDSAFEKYSVSKIKEKYHLSRYILFLARLHFEKAPCNLLKAFALIEKKYPDVALVFAGHDAGEAEKVKNLAKELGLERRVILTGKVSEEEKYQLLAGCEFLVLPSMCEAQGIVFIEAYAQGKTVIGTRVGGVPEIVKDNVTGLLVEYGDIKGLAEKIEYLLERPELRKEMGKKGREIACEKYRWKDIIDRIEKLYEEVIEERKSCYSKK
jgi:glycosyltransferase involved in cell wall biosynthesis